MNIIVNSRFNPFTYDLLVKPLEDYTKAYELVENLYSDLVTLTEAWKDIANRENSPEAYAMYKNYSDLLNSIVDDFSRGMTLNNRRQLLNMKRRYSSEITPIDRAYKAMQAANEVRTKAGSDAVFLKGMYTSIDDFLHGLTPNNVYESKKDVTARTAALTQAAVADIINDPIIRNSMNPLFLEIILRGNGVSFELLLQAIAGNAPATDRLMLVKLLMYKDLGFDSYDAEGQRALEGAINQGLYAGLSTSKATLEHNKAYKSPAEAVRLAIALNQEARALADWEASRGLRPIGYNKDGNPVYMNQLGETWAETSKGNVAGPKVKTKLTKSQKEQKKQSFKLGRPLVILNLKRISEEPVDRTEGNIRTYGRKHLFTMRPLEVHPSDIDEGALALSWDDLSRDELIFLENNRPDIAENRDKILISKQWVKLNDEGNWEAASEGDEGAELRLIIKDKTR